MLCAPVSLNFASSHESLEFPCLVTSHVSRLCVLTYVSLSGIAKNLFCVETRAFLAESRSLGSLTRCLLTYCKTAVLAVDVLWVLFCSLAVLDPRVGHIMDVLSPFISILCHSD